MHFNVTSASEYMTNISKLMTSDRNFMAGNRERITAGTAQSI
jgi:hypothetical protein